VTAGPRLPDFGAACKSGLVDGPAREHRGSNPQAGAPQRRRAKILKVRRPALASVVVGHVELEPLLLSRDTLLAGPWGGQRGHQRPTVNPTLVPIWSQKPVCPVILLVVVNALATFRLPAPVKLTQDCFGRRYAVRIGNVPAIMALPEITWEESRPVVTAPGSRLCERDLVARLGEAGLSDWEKHHAWAVPASWYSNPRFIPGLWLNMVTLEMRLRADQVTYGENTMRPRGIPMGVPVDGLFENIDAWFERVRTWIEVATDQDVDPNYPLRRDRVTGHGLELMTIEGDLRSSVTSSRVTHVIGDSQEAMTRTRFRRLLAALRDGRQPPDAHLLMRDARSDLRRSRFRKAVIDAGGAVELCLADFNRRVVGVTTGPKPTLGWFVNQKQISITAHLPGHTYPTLVDVRNDAIHHNIVPTATVAGAALVVAQQIVDRLEPLRL